MTDPFGLYNYSFFEPKPSLDTDLIHNKLMNCSELYFQYWTKGWQYNFQINDEEFEAINEDEGILEFDYFIKLLYKYLENSKELKVCEIYTNYETQTQNKLIKKISPSVKALSINRLDNINFKLLGNVNYILSDNLKLEQLYNLPKSVKFITIIGIYQLEYYFDENYDFIKNKISLENEDLENKTQFYFLNSVHIKRNKLKKKIMINLFNDLLNKFDVIECIFEERMKYSFYKGFKGYCNFLYFKKKYFKYDEFFENKYMLKN